MKRKIDSCSAYIILCILVALNGYIYPAGGIIAQGLQAILIALSIYYWYEANSKYNLPIYLKGLNVLALMFLLYGAAMMVNYNSIHWMRKVSSTEFLKQYLHALLPVYAFFVFAKKGLLTEKKMKYTVLAFFAIAIVRYSRARADLAVRAAEAGVDELESTMNVGYAFLALMPSLVLFRKKPLVLYTGLAICAYFIIMGMKRGAMLIGAVCLIVFIWTNLKYASRRQKFYILIATCVLLVVGVYFVETRIAESAFFRGRIEQTKAGDSSGRDFLYPFFYNHFINEENLFKFFFGNGAKGTLRIYYQYAHNDWLEVAISEGVLGLMVCLAYWICYFIQWRRVKKNEDAYMAIGMYLLIYFMETLFSMSYSTIAIQASMLIGYYLVEYRKPNNYEESLITN